MKKKVIPHLFLLNLIFLGLVLTDCISGCSGRQASASDIKESGEMMKYCNDSVYRKVYEKDGFVLLEKRDRDTIHFDKGSGPIDDEPATRMIRYYGNNPIGRRHPTTIDFDITTVNEIIAKLPGQVDGKSLRIYLAAYDKAAVDRLYSSLPVNERYVYRNFITAVLIGRSQGVEMNGAYNLGNLCPPNCPPGSSGPDENVSRLFRIAKARTDVPQNEIFP